MSIIHDALKKVQKSLTHKNDPPPAPPTELTPKASGYLYETPPPLETMPPVDVPSTEQKKPVQNKIKSFFAFICAMAITAGCIWYAYQQFRHDIPNFLRIAKKSFYQLIHKAEIPDFKTKRPEDLKPLGQITIPPPVVSTPSPSPNPSSSTTASTSTAQPAVPITLNVHGIMSNSSGNLALINDQVYQEGDEIDGAKIVKINLDSITVNINGTDKTIFVKN